MKTDIRKKIKDYIKFVKAVNEKEQSKNDWANKFIQAYYKWKKEDA